MHRWTTRLLKLVVLTLAALVFPPFGELQAAEIDEPVDIGSRRELFVDEALIERLGGGAELRLHHPAQREIALTFDKPWEGNASGYPTVIQDGDLYRMYYRGHRYILDPPPLRQAQPEVVCYAESRDGVTWVKPEVGSSRVDLQACKLEYSIVSPK